jgi:membrane protein DedA with SNARE-associated domain
LLIANILAWLASLVINIISATGYAGIFFLMTLESACIPIPSEVTMPFSGYLVSLGRFSLWQVALWGTVGNLAGSLLAYWLGYAGGRRLIEKYGKYLLISQNDLEIADRWFKKYGTISVFFSRLLPIVRTFISFPAGIARMDLKKFCLYTIAGSIPWSLALAYLGVKAGENWDYLKVHFHRFDLVVAMLIIAVFVWWFWRHLRRKYIKVNA